MYIVYIKRRSAQVDLLLISSWVFAYNKSSIFLISCMRNMRTPSNQIDSIITVSTRFPPGVLFLCVSFENENVQVGYGNEQTHTHNFDRYVCCDNAMRQCNSSSIRLRHLLLGAFVPAEGKQHSTVKITFFFRCNKNIESVAKQIEEKSKEKKRMKSRAFDHTINI